MKNDDVELIQRTLAGDNNAFSELVEKYQKQVHALAWRKIGDFHIAEDITQDTFLKAYQRLHTLKEPHRFAGWLYVIATRRCLALFRQKRLQTQVIENIDTLVSNKDAYSQHIAEEQAKTADMAQQEVVKKLLATLKESDRTVITLHYFGEMTCEEMSEFLGVSANTIKSRLRRARNRLKKEEPMIREAISNFQISPNLTDNIMQEVARLKPATPSASKPLVPWVIGTVSAVLIVLMLGIGSQYFARFQQPYSLDAQSETTVELIDAPVVQNLEAKPNVLTQQGERSDIGGRDNGAGEKSNQVLGDEGDYTLWGLPKGAKRRLGKGMFTDMHLSPDGSRLAIASSTGIWLYDVRTGKETALFTKNADLVGLVVFSPDGTTLASTGGDNTCRIWDIESQKLLLTFKVPDWLFTLTFLDDGKTLVGEGLIGKRSRTLTGKPLRWDVPKIWMWDTTTGKRLATYTTKLPKFNPLTDARISVRVKGFADHSRVIFAFENKDSTINVKNADTDRKIAILPQTGQEIRTFAFSPDGKRLAIAYTRVVHIWNIDTGKQIATFSTRVGDFYGNPSILDFSKDGKVLAVAGLQDISVWNVDTHSHIATFKNKNGGLWEFVLSSDGTTIVTLDHRGTVDLWSVNTGEHERTLSTGYAGRFSTLAFSHDGETIASTVGSKIHLWNTNTGTETMRFQVPTSAEFTNRHPGWNPRAVVPTERGSEIIGLAFSRDNTTLNTCNTSGKIGTWDVANGKYKISNTITSTSNVRSIPINSNPLLKGMITVPMPRTSNIYHLIATSFDNSSVYLPEVVFSPNGKILAAKNRKGAVEVWHIPTQLSLYKLTSQNPNLKSGLILAFSSNGKTLVVGENQDIHVSNTHTGETLAKFKIPIKKPNLLDRLKSLFGREFIKEKVDAIAIAQDRNTFLAASGYKTIYLWDVSTQDRILTIKGHTEAICKLAFASDGTILASSDVQGTIHLWDIPTGRKLATFKPYASPITQLVFSPDGKTLASTNLHSHFAGTILLWDVPSK